MIGSARPLCVLSRKRSESRCGAACDAVFHRRGLHGLHLPPHYGTLGLSSCLIYMLRPFMCARPSRKVAQQAWESLLQWDKTCSLSAAPTSANYRELHLQRGLSDHRGFDDPMHHMLAGGISGYGLGGFATGVGVLPGAKIGFLYSPFTLLTPLADHCLQRRGRDARICADVCSPA